MINPNDVKETPKEKIIKRIVDKENG